MGLLKALFELEGKNITQKELYEASIEVEINILKKPIGIQDQLAAVYGGFNFFKILKDGSIEIKNLDKRAENVIPKIFNKLILIWTSIQRNSSDILYEQEKNISKNVESIKSIKKLAYEFWELINNDFNSLELGELLEKGWNNKIKLASKISNDEIINLYEKCKRLGAHGGKLSGAGGGGFLLMVANESKKKNLIDTLNNYSNIDINYNPEGSRILLSE